jgi:hypothetical protein
MFFRETSVYLVLRIWDNQIFSIPDHGSRDPRSRSVSKIQILFLIFRICDPGCSSHPGSGYLFFTPPGSQIPDPGIKKAQDRGTGSATLLLCNCSLCYSFICITEHLISTKKKMSTVAKFKFSSLLGKDL